MSILNNIVNELDISLRTLADKKNGTEFCSSLIDFLYLPRVYMPIPLISTLLSAIAFNFIIFDSTGSLLDNTAAASSTISFINALGSFAYKILFKFNKNKKIIKCLINFI